MELRKAISQLLGMETAAELRAVEAVPNVGTLPGVVVGVVVLDGLDINTYDT